MDEKLQKAHGVLKVLSAAFVMSVLIMIGVGYFMVQQQGATFALDESLFPIIAGLGVVSLFLGQFIGKMLFSQASKEQDEDKLIGLYNTKHIIRLVFQESAVIFGLVLTLGSGDVSWVLGLGAATLLAYALAWPGRAELEELKSLLQKY